MYFEIDDGRLKKEVEESMADIEGMKPGVSERILAIVVEETQAVIEQIRLEIVTSGCQFDSLLGGKYDSLDALLEDIRDGLSEILDAVRQAVGEELGINYDEIDFFDQVDKLATAKSNLIVNEELRTFEMG
jgi:hypothetical protein